MSFREVIIRYTILTTVANGTSLLSMVVTWFYGSAIWYALNFMVSALLYVLCIVVM